MHKWIQLSWFYSIFLYFLHVSSWRTNRRGYTVRFDGLINLFYTTENWLQKYKNSEVRQELPAGTMSLHLSPKSTDSLRLVAQDVRHSKSHEEQLQTSGSGVSCGVKYKKIANKRQSWMELNSE